MSNGIVSFDVFCPKPYEEMRFTLLWIIMNADEGYTHKP